MKRLASRAGRIAKAGLNVHEREADVPGALRALENVTLPPHPGTAAEEVRDPMGLMVIDSLIAVRAGRVAPNTV